jgi:hypothetical protein
MILLLLWVVVGLAVGVVLHESAHYGMAKLFNRNPKLRHPTLQDPTVLYSVQFELLEGTDYNHRDTLILFAPVLVSIPLLALVVYGYHLTAVLHLPLLACACACGKPSPSDVAMWRENSAHVATCKQQDENHSTE